MLYNAKINQIILVCDSKIPPLGQVTGAGRGTEAVTWTVNIDTFVEFHHSTRNDEGFCKCFTLLVSYNCYKVILQKKEKKKEVE